jgi:hypothetical protein
MSSSSPFVSSPHFWARSMALHATDPSDLSVSRPTVVRPSCNWHFLRTVQFPNRSHTHKSVAYSCDLFTCLVLPSVAGFSSCLFSFGSTRPASTGFHSIGGNCRPGSIQFCRFLTIESRLQSRFRCTALIARSQRRNHPLLLARSHLVMNSAV